MEENLVDQTTFYNEIAEIHQQLNRLPDDRDVEKIATSSIVGDTNACRTIVNTAFAYGGISNNDLEQAVGGTILTEEKVSTDLTFAYTLVYKALLANNPRKSEHWKALFALYNQNPRYTVLAIEKELMKEEAKKVAKLAEDDTV